MIAGCLAAGRAGAALVLDIGQNFTGSVLGVDSQALPADANGAVGPAHFVEFINGRFSVYSKTNGARLQTRTDLSFWSQAGVTVPSGWNVTDPRIVYDPVAQRWFASQVDFDPSASINTNRFLLAVSATADPTGVWKAVAIPAYPGANNFADFPTLGLDARGVYLAGDVFDDTGNPIGSTLVSIPKADLLGGVPTASNRAWFGLLSYGSRGDILQPAVNTDGAAGDAPVLAVGDVGLDFSDHSNLVSFAVHNAAGPGAATLTTPTSISVAPYRVPLNPTQPGGIDTLDDGDARLSATVYQVSGVLYAVHGTQVGAHTALRWYRIHAASHAVTQSGTVADNNLDLFYPSIAANSSGTLVICCNGCNSDTFVSSYAILGETTNGTTTFGSLLLLKAGTATYERLGTGGVSRWGDYSATSVDPADPNRFWTIQMFPSGSSQWSTRITELRVSPLTLSAALSGANLLLSWSAHAAGYTLDTTTNPLLPNSWTSITQGLATNSGRISVALPTTNRAAYFRLQAP